MKYIKPASRYALARIGHCQQGCSSNKCILCPRFSNGNMYSYWYHQPQNILKHYVSGFSKKWTYQTSTNKFLHNNHHLQEFLSPRITFSFLSTVAVSHLVYELEVSYSRWLKTSLSPVKFRTRVFSILLQGTNISHLGKRKIIFKRDFWWDMLL